MTFWQTAERYVRMHLPTPLLLAIFAECEINPSVPSYQIKTDEELDVLQYANDVGSAAHVEASFPLPD